MNIEELDFFELQMRNLRTVNFCITNVNGYMNSAGHILFY